MSVFARHGFENLLERAKLGRFILEKLSQSGIQNYSVAQRLRMSFEQLGPTFIKFGQLLATRPDLIPQDFVDEFKRLHDQVQTIPFEAVEDLLKLHFGQPLENIFSEFNKTPLAAASIAQVYEAVLKDGSPVVVKVQRPGIETIIAEDLDILYGLAELLDRYVPETRPFNPQGIVDEFFKTLQLETNFVVEANNIRRFAENFANEPSIVIPQVFSEYSGQRVLVMEKLNGIPLSHQTALTQEGIDPEQVLRTGLRCYLKMVFSDGLFHGDLHAGNMFVMPDNKVGLIDFGVVGRLSKKTQTAIANMLISLAYEDYDRLAYEYVDLAPYSGHVDVDIFARQLRDLIAPYYGLTLKHVNVGKLLVDSTSVAARNGLILPSELVMFFKSIVTIEGMGRVIVKDFDFLQYSLEFASELVKGRYEGRRILQEAGLVTRDLASLMSSLPRQLKYFIRRVNSPDFSIDISVHQVHELKRSVESSSKILFLGLIIGSLILSASVLVIFDKGPKFFDIPMVSLISYSLASLLGMVAFYNYIKK